MTSSCKYANYAQLQNALVKYFHMIRKKKIVFQPRYQYHMGFGRGGGKMVDVWPWSCSFMVWLRMGSSRDISGQGKGVAVKSVSVKSFSMPP